jgi:ankyrin repeat protein
MSAARNARIAATSSVPAALMGQPLVAESANAAGGAARPAPGSGLLEAAAAGDADALENLLKRVAPDAERDAQGRTALALAVLRSDSRSVMLLLAHGADRHRADWHGQTPLDAALRLADPAVLKALGLP